MTDTENILEHEARIADIDAQLSGAREEEARLAKQALDVKNWLKGHGSMSSDELKAQALTAKHASATAELAQLTDTVQAAKQRVADMESERDALNAVSFASGDLLSARKASYQVVRDEWNSVLADEQTLIAQRDAAAPERGRIASKLTAAQAAQRRALSMDEVSAAGKEITSVAQEKADLDALISNIETALARGGDRKNELRRRLAAAERELWRAQSAAALDALRADIAFADTVHALKVAYAAAIRGGDAFDLGIFLASVVKDGGVFNGPAINALQDELGRAWGIVEGVTA